MMENRTPADWKAMEELQKVIPLGTPVLVGKRRGTVTGYGLRSRKFFVTFLGGGREKLALDKIKKA